MSGSQFFVALNALDELLTRSSHLNDESCQFGVPTHRLRRLLLGSLALFLEHRRLHRLSWLRRIGSMRKVPGDAVNVDLCIYVPLRHVTPEQSLRHSRPTPSSFRLAARV